MTVVLYKTSSDYIVVDKVLTDDLNVTGTLRGECSIMNPVIQFELPIVNDVRMDLSDFLSYNYCYIEDFNRYYYIQNFTVVNNKLVVAILSVDPLMSFADEIRNLNCVIARQENNYNLYINDPKIVSLCKPHIQVIPFDSSFSDTPLNIVCLAGAVKTISI